MAREAYRSLYGDLTKLKDKSLLNDPAGGAGDDDELFQLMVSVSDWVDRYCDRHFYPLTTTRYFDLAAGVLEFGVPDLIAVATLKDDENQDSTFETTWGTDDYDLLPLNAEPTQPWGEPYSEVRANLRSDGDETAGFPPGQKVIEIVGRWGYREHREASGSLIDNGAGYSAAATSIVVDDGSDFAVGQTIVIGSEQLLVTAIATNTLTVVRGLNGTTAAAISDNDAVDILRWPASVERGCLLTAARLWTRAPAFEPFYVGADVDTDVRLLLEPYRRKAV